MNKHQLINELKTEGFSELIVKAFEKVKREKFIPEHLKPFAYKNEPIPIGEGSTISQPYTIAFMLELLELDKLSDIGNDKFINNKNEWKESSRNQEKPHYPKVKKFDVDNKNEIKILEIGSGSGYVLALIDEILKNIFKNKIKNTKKLSDFGATKIKNFSSYKIYGIELNKELVNSSSGLFKKNKKIKVIYVDGSKGLPKEKPFDRILVSAAFEEIPENLFEQLKEYGILVTPVRNSIYQIKKQDGRIKTKEFPGFIFVPVIEDKNR